jgi:hypothetical protein
MFNFGHTELLGKHVSISSMTPVVECSLLNEEEAENEFTE